MQIPTYAIVLAVVLLGSIVVGSVWLVARRKRRKPELPVVVARVV
jgi:hypothetical protein